MNVKVTSFKILYACNMLFVCAICSFLAICSFHCESMASEALSKAFVLAAKDINLSVVNIRTTKAPNNTAQRKGQNKYDSSIYRMKPSELYKGTGVWRQNSGIIVDKKGHIITNEHVVKGAKEIIVRLHDKSEFKAEIVGTDPKTDIAVLKIDAEGLWPAKFGDSDSLEIGEIVLAVGRDYGLGQTVISGIISAKGGQNIRIGGYEGFLQTNAAIDNVNSGGPLINLQGKVIGVNTVIVTTQTGGYSGMSYAIPINMVKGIIGDLIAHGKVTRGWFGVSAQPFTPQLKKALGFENKNGALISGVEPNSPAVIAGLKSGDVVIEYDGKKINDLFQLRNGVTGTKINDEVEVVVIRDGKELRLKAKIIERLRGNASGKEGLTESLGLMVQTLTEELAFNFGYESETGVVITSVRVGGPAHNAKLKVRDLIVEVQHKLVVTVEDFQQAIMDNQEKQEVLLFVKRPNGALSYVVLKVDRED